MSPVLEQIRTGLPTHIVLTPMVHRWREGDICFKVSGNSSYIIEVYPLTIRADMKEWIGKPVEHTPRHILCGRRPIPPHILDNQAYYLWLDGFADITSGKFTRAEMDKNESEGRLYDKWLLEQMELNS